MPGASCRGDHDGEKDVVPVADDLNSVSGLTADAKCVFDNDLNGLIGAILGSETEDALLLFGVAVDHPVTVYGAADTV
jgi:hypothetical protein